MNNLCHTIRKFNRFELKYILSIKQAQLFKTALRAYLVADEHSNGHYGLSSLYYDSPDYRCYREKVEGVSFRRKLRIRHYETDKPVTGSTPVFVEIKQRVDRVTQKRRVILPYREALRLCNERRSPDCDPRDEQTICEIEAFLWQYNLRPACLVRYERQAFIGTEFDIGLRVTFDTDLTYQTHPLRLDDPSRSLPLFPTGTVVMEIKVNERIPYWLTDLLAAYNLQMARMSKYCRSIELAELDLNPIHTPFYLPLSDVFEREK
jgi:SPX domain protein involved in polyphosphate accumulation